MPAFSTSRLVPPQACMGGGQVFVRMELAQSSYFLTDLPKAWVNRLKRFRGLTAQFISSDYADTGVLGWAFGGEAVSTAMTFQHRGSYAGHRAPWERPYNLSLDWVC